jgi:hypothetical protein
MDQLFGLKIWPTRLTDSQYVDRVRWKLRWGKRLALLQGAIGCGIVYILCAFIQLAAEILGLPAANRRVEEIALGFPAALLLLLMARCVITNLAFSIGVLKAPRALPLLVKYHDRLVELGDVKKSPPHVATQHGIVAQTGSLVSATSTTYTTVGAKGGLATYHDGLPHCSTPCRV